MVPQPPDEGRSDTSRRLSRTLRAGLSIVLSGGSFLLALLQFLLGESPKLFFLGNLTPLPTRLVIVGVAWVLATGTALLLWIFWGRKSESALRRFESCSRILCPLLVSSFVPPMFVEEAWPGHDIAFFSYVFAVGLATERLLRVALSELRRVVGVRGIWKRPPPSWWSSTERILPWIIVLGLSGWYIARIGVLTNIGHQKLMTTSSDLAEYDNMFFNALSGHPWRSPAIAGHLEDFSTLQGHAEFALYLLLPFYALSPGAHALLWIQTCVVGLTAIPLFLFARDRLGGFCGLCFAAAYLMMPAVQQPNFYDFHFTPVGMFFAAWLMYFVSSLAGKGEKGGPRVLRVLVYVALGLTLLCREDTSIGTAVLGVFLVLSGVRVRDGLRIFAVSAFYFVFMKFGFMPLFGRWWFDDMYHDLKAQGAGGFGAVVLTLISNPSFVLRTMLNEAKLLYVLHMIVPLLALWLRRPLLWMAVLPGFVGTLLVTNRPALFQASFQYTYSWIAYVFCASILALRRGDKANGSALAVLLVALALSNQMGVFPQGEKILGGFLPRTFEMTESEKKRYQELREIIALIPRDASVSATEAEGPHVSNRPIMYSLKYTLGESPDYLLVRNIGVRAEKEHVRKALESEEYGVVERRGPFILVERGADTEKNGLLWRKVGGKPRSRSKGIRRKSTKAIDKGVKRSDSDEPKAKD